MGRPPTQSNVFKRVQPGCLFVVGALLTLLGRDESPKPTRHPAVAFREHVLALASLSHAPALAIPAPQGSGWTPLKLAWADSGLEVCLGFGVWGSGFRASRASDAFGGGFGGRLLGLLPQLPARGPDVGGRHHSACFLHGTAC